MDVHGLRGIISSGVFLPRKDEMAQTTHVILDSIPWLLNSISPCLRVYKIYKQEWNDITHEFAIRFRYTKSSVINTYHNNV